MKKEYNYKNAESAERERRHQFGQPDGNEKCNPRDAVNQRWFYAWVESKATKEELVEYAKDESKPAMRRRFVMASLKCESMDDFFALTNQTHGAPKQKIEVEEIPNVRVEFVRNEV